MKTKEEIAQYKKEWAVKNKEKLKERLAEYYQSNREKLKNRNKKRYSENKEEILNKQKSYYHKNHGRINQVNRKYALKNSEKIFEYKKKYNAANKERFKVYFANHYQENKEYHTAKSLEYRKINKDKIALYNQKNKNKKRIHRLGYDKNRKSNDPLYKLTVSIRCSIAGAIKRNNYSKTCKTSKILGCTFGELKLHLESKFEPWMNWSNYGNWNGQPKELNAAWDIDHIIPLSSATTEEELIGLNHYTNLQPLCSYYNRYVKSNNTKCILRNNIESVTV